MSPIGEPAIWAMLSQFDKRDNSETQEHDPNGMSPGEVLAIVIAALTLLVAMIPLFRRPRFRWVSSLISPFKAFGITPPNPMSTAVTTSEDPSTTLALGIPIPLPIFIYSGCSGAHLVDARSNTFRYSQNGTTGEDGTVLRIGEAPGPRRPERAVTYPLQ
ncbi:hypothetical protein B9Z19DRAFT_1194556 [Tuber borchii]|uniref:Uncharacterized protein n=1 Tax=Tuber borchii TaxID=42251 RepID=A0A2T6ZMG7_TUBBO|nr:hypothetical protein B9Z19DRAFT_1194556 [Tuber borchii]